MGGHGREAINNSLVYTGRAATLRNAGHPGGDGKEQRKVRLPDFYVLFYGCSHFRRGKTHKQCPDKLSLLQNPQIFHTGDIQVEVCRRFLTENQLKTHTVSPPKPPNSHRQPLNPALFDQIHTVSWACAPARCSLLWRRLTADLKAPHSALYIVPVTPQYTLSKEGLATELYASITNLQRPSCEVAAVLNFKFPSLKKKKKKKNHISSAAQKLASPKELLSGSSAG